MIKVSLARSRLDGEDRLQKLFAFLMCSSDG